MKRACTRILAATAAVALSVQSTGAASLPFALTFPRAAFPPPASRFAAFPAARPAAAPAKAPSGFAWLESAHVVADFVLARVQEELDPSLKAARADRPAPDASAPMPSFAPMTSAPQEPAPIITPLNTGPADRMMVVMEPGRSVDAVLRDGLERDFSTPPKTYAGPAPVLKPFHGPWREANGVRARASYFRPRGLIHTDPAGFTAVYADGTTLHATGHLPDTSLQEFPIYFHGEEVDIQLTIENKTGRTLRDVQLEAVQENFRPVGTEGMRLAPPIELKVADALAPGARAIVHWSFRLEGPSHEAVNLEQTHVRVMADGQAAPLLNAPQAGVIDPPGPGWR